MRGDGSNMWVTVSEAARGARPGLRSGARPSSARPRRRPPMRLETGMLESTTHGAGGAVTRSAKVAWGGGAWEGAGGWAHGDVL
jgi:hypothetical protein